MHRSFLWVLAIAALLAGIGNASEHVSRWPQSPGESRIRAQVVRSNASFVAPDPAIVKILLRTGFAQKVAFAQKVGILHKKPIFNFK